MNKFREIKLGPILIQDRSTVRRSLLDRICGCNMCDKFHYFEVKGSGHVMEIYVDREDKRAFREQLNLFMDRKMVSLEMKEE